jgi:hypothetical protein
MPRRVKKQPTYCSVFAVKDGTIWHASTKRKPDRAAASDIDEDGVFNTFVEKIGEEAVYTPVARLVRGSTLATCLNLKRTLRNRVECRLAAIVQQLAELKTQADHVEAMVGELAGTRKVTQANVD